MNAPETDLWRIVFGNTHPVEVEIGPGRGDVALAFAAAHPERNFFAIEHANGLAHALAVAAAERGLGNLRAIAGDARCILATLVPPASVAAVHVYFPDPWPKTRHRRRRLFDTPDAARAVARVLEPGGRVHVASDLAWLFRHMVERLTGAGLHPDASAGPPRPLSKFERKYAAAGTWAATFVRRAD